MTLTMKMSDAPTAGVTDAITAARYAVARDAEVSVSDEMTFDEWLRIGMESGWVGPPCCSTHDGTPMSDEEAGLFEEGGDPCMFVLRLYDDPEAKRQIEADHSPSQWRNPFRSGS